ncbi:MAG: PspA/IM30 family protein [Ornithinimicrobium sp.]
MTQKQTILGRIGQMARANINSILDRAEDPEKMLDQLVRDYTSSIAEAEEAVAQTIANVRMSEADLRADEEAAGEWGRKAGAASAKAESLRSQGDTEGADKFDNLAKLALSRQIQHEDDASTARPAIESQNSTVEQLKAGLVTMKTKLEDLKGRRSQLIARARAVEAQSTVNDAMSSLDVLDPNSELSRFEDKIKREEAVMQGRSEARATTLEDQFAELEDHSHDSEVEARLAALKSGNA